MLENQYHQGERLKKIISDKGINVTKIAKKIGLTRQAYAYNFTIEIIKKDKLLQLLYAAGITWEDYNGIKKIDSEVEELRKKLVESLEENVALNKLLRQCEDDKKALEKGLKKAKPVA